MTQPTNERWKYLLSTYPEAAAAFRAMRNEFPEDIAIEFSDANLEMWIFEISDLSVVAHHWQEEEGVVPLVWRHREQLWRDFGTLPPSEIDELGLRVLMDKFKAQTRAEAMTSQLDRRLVDRRRRKGDSEDHDGHDKE